MDSVKLESLDSDASSPRVSRRSSVGAEATYPFRQSDGHTIEEIILLGQQPLRKYLRYVRDDVVNGKNLERNQLIDEWARATDHYERLSRSEAGIADEIGVRDLDPRLDPLVAELKADPRYISSFTDFPASLGMVELDRLVVDQRHVTRSFTDERQAQLGRAPDPEALFRFCQPVGSPEAPVKVRKVGNGRYVFSTESTDLRSHEAVLLRPDQLVNHDFGPVTAVVGLAVGFGPNLMFAVAWKDRLVLQNGYHRAYTLRSLGITHAPCIIRKATRHAELELAMGENVPEDPDHFFLADRPPILKDFFDPKIFKVHRVRKKLMQIEIEFETREYDVEA